MKHSILRILLIAGVLTAFARLAAAPVEGKVSAVTGSNVTITFDAGAKPKAGDEVEIFFKLAGLDEEVSVASGKVTSVSGQTAEVAIQNGTGTVAKDQLARITPTSTAKTTDASAIKPAPSSIQGDWTGTAPDGSKLAFGFKGDGSLLWVVEQPDTAQSSIGKYRIDASVQPQGIELFDLEHKDLIGEVLSGIFEIQSDGRLKIDLSIGHREGGGRDFTEGAVLLSRATSPTVRSSKPTPTPYVAPTPPTDDTLVRKGIGLYDRGDDDGAIAVLYQAIALNPKNAYAFYWRGTCLARKRDFQGAFADWEAAMKLDPEMKLKALIETTKAVEEIEGKKK